jgi:putative transposase
LGVINLLSIAVEGEQQSIAYSGRPALSDWWYISKKIQRLESIARTVNKRGSTIQIRRLRRKRRCRYHQYVNTIVRRAVEYLWYRGVSKLVVGDLRGILANVHGRRKTNTMTHNFWSHEYLIQRVKEVAEEFNIAIELINERGTSSTCPRCGSNQITRRGRLFKCQGCKLEANRDGVGAVNIGLAHGEVFPREVINRAVACPLEVRI